MKLAVVIVTVFLLTIAQAGFYRRFWHRGLAVKLDFCQQAAVEGDTARLKEIISNRQYLPLPVLHVKFQMGKHLVFTSSNNFKITDQNYRSDIFSCLPWQEIRRTLDFSCKRRGYYRIGSVDLVSYDLFLLEHFAVSVPADAAMYVYPGPADALRLKLPLKNLMGQILARQALLRDPFEIRGIRPYQPFDPYKQINWKASARTGELQVNVCTPASSWMAVLLLDTDSDQAWGDEDLTEESIRLCGSIAEYLIGQGVPVAVYSNGADCLSGQPSRIEAGAGPKHLKAIMELLARLGYASRAPLSVASLRAIAGSRYEAEGSAEGDGSYLPMERLISFLMDSGDAGRTADSAVYVLISPIRRKELSLEFDSLCLRSPGSQWIFPRRPDGFPPAVYPKHAQIYEWEVPYGRT